MVKLFQPSLHARQDCERAFLISLINLINTRDKGSKVHAAVDTLGHLIALLVTPANEQDRAQVAELAEQVQEITGEMVKVAFVDQGYTGEQANAAAEAEGIRLEVIKLPAAKRGFVLLPRRWVVRSLRGP